MIKKIEQKLRGEQQVFMIVEDGVLVHRNYRNNKESYKVNFENINSNQYISIKSADTLTYLFVFSALLNIILLNVIIQEMSDIPEAYGMWIFMGLIGVFVIILVLLREHFIKVDIKSLEADKPLIFFYTKKTKDEVDLYIKTILKSQKQYFRNKYFKVDPVLPFHTQKERVLWLYDKEFITENEYIIVLEELEAKRAIDGE